MVRGLLAWEWTDLEGRLLEVEGLCVVREYLAVRSLLGALERFRERLPPEAVVEAMRMLLERAEYVARLELDRYGVYVGVASTVVALERDAVAWFLERDLERESDGKAVGSGEARVGAGEKG